MLVTTYLLKRGPFRPHRHTQSSLIYKSQEDNKKRRNIEGKLKEKYGRNSIADPLAHTFLPIDMVQKVCRILHYTFTN